MEQKNNSVSSAETKDDSSTIADVTTSSPNNAKPNVIYYILSNVSKCSEMPINIDFYFFLWIIQSK
jgi:hypothetical protein